jgi:hypothetical protein
MCENLTFIGYLCEIRSMCENMANSEACVVSEVLYLVPDGHYIEYDNCSVFNEE